MNLIRTIDEICALLDAREPFLQALLPEPDRRARLLSEAHRIEVQHPDPANRPPLFGQLVGVKDLFHVEGMETRAGSSLPAEVLAGPEAAVVTRLKEAGAIILGKTVATEFAFADPGPTRNPHHPDHTPGGSSSGSAASVAAGYCPLALGTQTIGSIARPASYCGVIGFKPSYGRISTDGAIPFSQSVDHVGFFVRRLHGIAEVAPVLVDDWIRLDSSIQPLSLRVGVPCGAYLDQAEPEMRDWFDRYVESLAVAGHDVRFVDLFPDWLEWVEMHYDLIAAEMADVHAEWFPAYGDRYRSGSRQLIERGLGVSPKRFAAARAGREQLRDHVHAVMMEEDIDVWLTPSATGPAPEGLDFTGNPRMNLPWSYTGLPTITTPAAKTPKGLPLGLQWVGAYGQDEQLLRIVEQCVLRL